MLALNVNALLIAEEDALMRVELEFVLRGL